MTLARVGLCALCQPLSEALKSSSRLPSSQAPFPGPLRWPHLPSWTLQLSSRQSVPHAPPLPMPPLEVLLGLSDNHYPTPPSPAVGVSSWLTADMQLWLRSGPEYDPGVLV